MDGWMLQFVTKAKACQGATRHHLATRILGQICSFIIVHMHFCRVQIIMQILGCVRLAHLVNVIQTPRVPRLHLTCVPVIRPAATGVNAITDTSVMDSPAHVSHNWLFIHREAKKVKPPGFLILTSSNIGRFCEFFRCHTDWEMCNTTAIE